MPHLIVYLLKANTALCLFYLAYRLLLRRLTFYYLNRAFLVFGIVFSAVYPLIDLSALFIKHEAISRQLIIIVPNWQNMVPVAVQQHPSFDYWQIIVVLFWAGVILMAIRLIIQLISLYKIYKSSTSANYIGQQFRSVKNEINPFSFWQTIYLNPEKHHEHELYTIFEHEKIHVKQWHTLDVLLAELSTVFYWFNPGVWLMKQAIKENLEFITDRKILQSGIDEKVYQYSLVRVSSLKQSAAIVNNFNFLTIKKRIMMMNKKQTSKFQVSRYIILLPLVVILALVFTVSKAELSPKSISAFVKKVLPNAITNYYPHNALIVAAIPKINPVITDTVHNLVGNDTTNLKRSAGIIKETANDSTIVDSKNHLITLYGEAKYLSGSGVLKANVIKAESSGGNIDLKKALYVFDSGKDQIFSDSYAQVSGIDPSKIDSMSILRSTHAMALYGNKAQYGAVIIKLKPVAANDVLQMSETRNNAGAGGSLTKTTTFNSSSFTTDKATAAYAFDTNRSITSIARGDKMMQGVVLVNSSSDQADSHADAKIINPNADNDNEINCIINPKGADKTDFKTVVKLFKDNGFDLNFNKEYIDDSLDLLKISLTSDRHSVSATYRVKELIDTHYNIIITANKVTKHLTVQSVKSK